MQPLVDYSREHDIILDGEIYSPDLTFQEITGFVMTKDFEDPKTIKKHGEVLTIPEDLKFYCFDYVDEGMLMDCYFSARNDLIKRVQKLHPNLISPVNQITVNSKEEVEEYFEEALKNDYEGLILKDPKGRYKCGRGTIKEGLIYKVKPFVTFDAEILGVVQATEVDPNAEKKINELGRSVTSKKLGDRVLIEKAAGFEVEYKALCDKCLADGQTGVIIKQENTCRDCGAPYRLKVTLAMTDEEKEDVWATRSTYIGKMIEYKGMLVGSKDVPRHPVCETDYEMIRFREDKD
jgi:hypothetical protein